jgi:hypothetical protein
LELGVWSFPGSWSLGFGALGDSVSTMTVFGLTLSNPYRKALSPLRVDPDFLRGLFHFVQLFQGRRLLFQNFIVRSLDRLQRF